MRLTFLLGLTLLCSLFSPLGLVRAEEASRASPPASAFADAVSDTPRILAIGDSLMAWHGVSKNSIPDVVSDELGEPVISRAVGGARVIYGLPISGALGLKIPKQFRDEAYDWVIVNGGGNDLWLGCGCNQCNRRISRMIAPDGQKGEIPTLIGRIRATGAKVVYIGYLRSPGVGSIIDACKPHGDELEGRIDKMAAQQDGVYFMSLQDLVAHGDRSMHGVDMIHPSLKASGVIGKRVAEIIKSVDERR